MQLKIENLSTAIGNCEFMAQFERPLDKDTVEYLKERGFRDAEVRATGCLGWIWCQWLNSKKPCAIRACVETFVRRGMEAQDCTNLFYARPEHDLLLLHCAILGASKETLADLADRVIDASGYRKYTPSNDGDLYACARVGMLKHWIRGDFGEAAKQAEICWRAYRHPSMPSVAKTLVVAWLEREWDQFAKHQFKDFERLWKRSKKDQILCSEAKQNTVVDLSRIKDIHQQWCWAHCAMAMLAYREGVVVETDEFWFPSVALE